MTKSPFICQIVVSSSRRDCQSPCCLPFAKEVGQGEAHRDREIHGILGPWDLLVVVMSRQQTPLLVGWRPSLLAWRPLQQVYNGWIQGTIVVAFIPAPHCVRTELRKAWGNKCLVLCAAHFAMNPWALGLGSCAAAPAFIVPHFKYCQTVQTVNKQGVGRGE